jgi:hypothetical protein
MINYTVYQNQQCQLKLIYILQLKLLYIRNRNVVKFPKIHIVIFLYYSLLMLARQTPDIGKHLQLGYMRQFKHGCVAHKVWNFVFQNLVKSNNKSQIYTKYV